NHVPDSEIAAQLPLDFGPRTIRVAIRIEQTFLGGQTGALAIHMDGAAFEHEGRSVPIGALELQHLLRDLVIAVPGEVQPAVQAAPGVEGPIDAAASAL